ncbi:MULTISPECIES: hypothetical protein [Nitrosopumilus]|nr:MULTISPECIES: hypothetical protein [Nitrosopumilus]
MYRKEPDYLKEFSTAVDENHTIEHLEEFMSDMASGFQRCEHKFSHNGTISCIKCGKTMM